MLFFCFSNLLCSFVSVLNLFWCLLNIYHLHNNNTFIEFKYNKITQWISQQNNLF